MFRRREKPSGQNQNTMLRTIATGKKPMGAKRQPKPTAMALAAYLLTVATSTRLTVRQLAAALDRDPRSCRTAVDQLITFGVDGLTWSDADALTFTPTEGTDVGTALESPAGGELGGRTYNRPRTG